MTGGTFHRPGLGASRGIGGCGAFCWPRLVNVMFTSAAVGCSGAGQRSAGAEATASRKGARGRTSAKVNIRTGAQVGRRSAEGADNWRRRAPRGGIEIQRLQRDSRARFGYAGGAREGARRNRGSQLPAERRRPAVGTGSLVDGRHWVGEL